MRGELFELSPVWREGRTVKLLDQRKLPEEVVLELTGFPEVCRAISDMAVRGAGAIGITAAYASALALDEGLTPSEFLPHLFSTRPTAVELRRGAEWVVEGEGDPWDLADSYKEKVEREALASARKAASFISDGDVLMTHCHTGSLAIGGVGTALGAIKVAWADGKDLFVWVKETRPRVQGSITAWELSKAGIPHRVIVDSAAAYVIKKEGVRSVFLGADRVARDLSVANKIGTLELAVVSAHFGVGFFVVTLERAFDRTVSGEEIPIEERDGGEIPRFLNVRFPIGEKFYNPAFDVVGSELITAIITEEKVYHGGRWVEFQSR